MQVVPATLVRITRYYMLAAIFYLQLTLAIGIWRALAPPIDPLLHWAPAVLGWISFPIMGAFYQFFPTLQGRDLAWERLTIPQFVLMNVGLLGTTGGALIGSPTLSAVGATIYLGGGLLFAAIIVLANVERSKVALTLRFFLAALAFFVIALLLFWGRQLGIGPDWAARGLILHLLVFGWAIMSIMGAEYSMVPMLQLKELRHPRLASAQFYLVGIGFLGLAFALGSRNLPLSALSGTVILLSVALFTYIMVASLRHGPDRLPRMDISVKYFLVGIAYLIATVATGIAMAAFGWWMLLPIHVHLGLIGVVTITIVGAMYHIVPFVVWWEVYAPRLGYEEVPLLKQIFDERGAILQLYGLNAGLLVMVGGFWLRSGGLVAIGGSLLMLSSLAFAWAMWGVVAHRKHLRSPNPAKPSASELGAKT